MELFEIAKKKSKYSFFEKILKVDRSDEIADNFIAAAKKLKLEKLYETAAESYSLAAKYDERYDYYIEAAKCYEKCNDQLRAIECYKKAISIVSDHGIAGKYEEHLFDMTKNAKCLDAAMRYYESIDNSLSIDRCLKKMIEITTDKEEIIKLYTQRISLTNADYISSKNKIIEFVFKILLYKFSISHDAHEILELSQRYKDSHPYYDGSRECTFLESILQCETEEEFTNIVYEYDFITKLSAELTTLLLDIKKNAIENVSIL